MSGGKFFPFATVWMDPYADDGTGHAILATKFVLRVARSPRPRRRSKMIAEATLSIDNCLMRQSDDTSPPATTSPRRSDTTSQSALGRRARRCPEILGRRVPVDPQRLARNHRACGAPAFVERGYYVDEDFVCADCGIAGVWTAARQRWWYEVIRGDPWTAARRCARCRRRERERIVAARRAQADGEGRNAARKTRADCWQAVEAATRARRRKRLRKRPR